MGEQQTSPRDANAVRCDWEWELCSHRCCPVRTLRAGVLKLQGTSQQQDGLAESSSVRVSLRRARRDVDGHREIFNQ